MNLQFLNLDWYTIQIKVNTNQIDNRFKLRKEYVYENGYKTKAVVVYAVLSKREVLDNKLQELTIPSIEDAKYISFRNTLSNDKVGALYLNNMNNIKVQHETLMDINMLEEVEYNTKKASVREILLSIKYNKQ